MVQSQVQSQTSVLIVGGMVEFVQIKVFLQYNKHALNVLEVVKK